MFATAFSFTTELLVEETVSSDTAAALTSACWMDEAMVSAITNESIYNNLSGEAFVLTETWKATGETKYRQAALLATQSIADAAKPSRSGVTGFFLLELSGTVM